MRVSAQLALTWVRAHREGVAPGVEDAWFAQHDIHLHVPAGATPKDGPSAGITMVTALVSMVTGRCVRADVAMTGEVTLTGQVLPIGGLKEKALAAQRAGIATILCPTLNEPDVEDIPAHLRRKLEFHFVDTVDQVLELALEPAREPRAGRTARV
jgi:ATP-dependent Lon protease